MDLNNVRRVSSAGYRLPERACGVAPITSRPPADRTMRAKGGGDHAESDRRDPVKQDRVWKEAVQSERRGAREWEKNWNFLKNYDQMGQLKPQEPLPSYVSLFSDHVPNTSNQMFGSRLSTPLGISVVRLDRMSHGRHRRSELDPEMQPC
ncbi:uncharacterized protein C2orf50 homolog [Pseudoliparis swirei]|uniref:uncharacterized protein C2orf50 homolog n=1 Tax=Pseudoliparis swirei TaxID=2059687 RepID=UPI0024BDB5EB|nr:uncharacterized protein C2orf50 homolog [Pseudoliparis swirei]